MRIENFNPHVLVCALLVAIIIAVSGLFMIPGLFVGIMTTLGCLLIAFCAHMFYFFAYCFITGNDPFHMNFGDVLPWMKYLD